MKKVPLWELLVKRGFAPDRRTAEAFVLSGRVVVEEARADSAGARVSPEADVRVKGRDMPYVGKGGLKLEGALRDFGISAAGRVALDTGASSGGFTDCLLQHGAARVYAVDAGFGQLAGKLRIDPRVVNRERTNISDVRADELQPAPDLATVDLSYLSLRQGIPLVARLLSPGSDILSLVKPLFEVDDARTRRTGVITDSTVYETVLRSLATFADAAGFAVRGVTHSPVTGNAGTREFFLWLRTPATDATAVRGPADATGRTVRLDYAAAVAAALALEPYRQG